MCGRLRRTIYGPKQSDSLHRNAYFLQELQDLLTSETALWAKKLSLSQVCCIFAILEAAHIIPFSWNLCSDAEW